MQHELICLFPKEFLKGQQQPILGIRKGKTENCESFASIAKLSH